MPLTGIRILDLSRLLPGPYATRLLAELGAEVVKVEDPEGGDYARWAPPLAGDPPTSGMFAELNRGKRSVALDLKSPEGVEALKALALRSDVLVDSFRPGVLSRLGLDPKALMSANPRLIYCSLSGFGLTGPDAKRAGHDIGFLARSGAIALSGSVETPIISGVQIADVGGALVAVAGILAALLERSRTGKGAVVDTALAEIPLGFAVASFGALHAGDVPKRGSEVLDGSRPCYAVYRTKDDRFLAVGALEPRFWSTFIQTIGLPEFEANGLDVGADGVRIKARVQARLLEKTRDEWTAIFREHEACVEPVLELNEVERDAQMCTRNILRGDGIVRSPIRVTDWEHVGGRDTRDLAAAPTLGQDTEAVLRETELPESLLRKLI